MAAEVQDEREQEEEMEKENSHVFRFWTTKPTSAGRYRRRSAQKLHRKYAGEPTLNFILASAAIYRSAIIFSPKSARDRDKKRERR